MRHGKGGDFMLDLFKFFVEADINLEKSKNGDKRIIQGYASTPAEDRQGESLIQKGMDITDFVDNGYINYDHDNSIILGYPTKNTNIDSKGLWVEAELLKGVPMADKIWDLATALKRNNAPRKLGFSVEGKVLERDGSKIVKAKIYNCAVTPNPVNTEATWEAVVKSFSKAMDAGYSTTPDSQVGGGALRKEDLLKDIKNLAENLDNYDYWSQVKSVMANGGNCTPAEMTIYLQLSKGLSRKQAIDIINKFN